MSNTSPQANQQFTSANDQKTADSDRLIEVIGEALLDRKAEDITVLDGTYYSANS